MYLREVIYDFYSFGKNLQCRFFWTLHMIFPELIIPYMFSSLTFTIRLFHPNINQLAAH